MTIPRELNTLPSDIAAWGNIPSQYAPQRNPDAKPDTAVQIFPPWLYEIPSAADFFNMAGRPPLVLPGNATLEPPELRLEVLAGYQGVVRFVEIFVDAPTTALDVVWQARLNGAVVPGFGNLASFPRVASNLSIVFAGIIRLPQASVFTVNITNNNATPWTVGASFGGWTWSTQDAERLTGGIYGAQG